MDSSQEIYLQVSPKPKFIKFRISWNIMYNFWESYFAGYYFKCTFPNFEWKVSIGSLLVMVVFEDRKITSFAFHARIWHRFSPLVEYDFSFDILLTTHDLTHPLVVDCLVTGSQTDLLITQDSASLVGIFIITQKTQWKSVLLSSLFLHRWH